MKKLAYVGMLLAAVSTRAGIGTPVEVPGCALWLDGADASTYDGSPVAQWRDKSGWGHHVTQDNSALRPAVDVGSLNGLNTLVFGGSHFLTGEAILPAGSQNFTFFGVWRKDVQSGAGVLFEQYGSGGNGSRCSFMASGGFGFTGQNADLRPVPYTAGEWMLSGGEYDGREADNIVFWSPTGVYGGTINRTVLNIGAIGTRIGANGNAGECLNGALAEVIVYAGELNDTQRNAVLYYLQEKWALGAKYQDAAQVIGFGHGRLPDGWIGTGTAFGINQPYTKFPGDTYNNQDFFIDSRRGGSGGNSDAKTGDITSPAFILSNNTVRVLVGGGDKAGGAQVQLERLANNGTWEVVRRSTGMRNDQMREIRWNTANLVGQTVRFAAFDYRTDSWGCIFFDSISFADEVAPEVFDYGFEGGKLPPHLFTHIPFLTPTVEVTPNNTLRFAHSGKYDMWNTTDCAPKVIFKAEQPETFTLQAHINSFTNTDDNRCHAGLILIYETIGTNLFDNILFGPFALTQKMRIERSGMGQIGNEWTGTLSNVWLRITGAKGKLTFLCSDDGTNWSTTASYTTMGTLLNAGLCAKTYNDAVKGLNVEFDSFSWRTVTTNSPASVPGCVLWLDADDAASVVPDTAGAVRQWRDRSGFGNHVHQPNETLRPTPISLNGRTVLAFNGNNVLNGPPVWQSGETNFTMFTVWRRDTGGGSQVVIEQDGGGDRGRAALHTIASGGYGFCGKFNDNYTLGHWTTDVWNLSGLEYSGTPADNVYLDAAGVVTRATIDSNKENVGVTGFSVGGHVTVTSERLWGCVAEVLAFNRILTASERYNVLAYLDAKWQTGYGYTAEPADIPAHSFTVANGSSVDLHGRTETYAGVTLADDASVMNGTLIAAESFASGGEAHINGNLTLAQGATLVNAQNGFTHVDGTLTFGVSGTVQVTLNADTRGINRTLFNANTLSGVENLDAWLVEGVPASWHARLIIKDGVTVVLKGAPQGTTIMIQ